MKEPGSVSAGADMQAEMLACEEALLHTDFSGNPALLEALLAGDFCEISPQGTVSDRHAVIAWLLQKNPAQRWQIDELTVKELAPGLRLASYRAQHILPVKSAGKGARHSSLWSYSKSLQCWQLHFHQATRIA